MVQLDFGQGEGMGKMRGLLGYSAISLALALSLFSSSASLSRSLCVSNLSHSLVLSSFHSVSVFSECIYKPLYLPLSLRAEEFEENNCNFSDHYRKIEFFCDLHRIEGNTNIVHIYNFVYWFVMICIRSLVSLSESLIKQ